MTPSRRVDFLQPLLALAASPALAATLLVSMDGTDGPACGPKAAACRTIGQAIENSADGGMVIVEAGIYGDVDGDGVLGEAGEESPVDCGGTPAMICIDKRLRLLSRTGASTTVVDAGGVDVDAVRIRTSMVFLGKRKRGFMIARALRAGIVVEPSLAGGRIENNRVIGAGGAGIDVGSTTPGGSHLVRLNEVWEAGGDGFVLGDGVHAAGSVATLNAGHGFVVGGGSVRGSISTENGGGGFVAATTASELAEDVAIGNVQGGFVLENGPHALSTSSALANDGPGIRILAGETGHTVQAINFASNDAGGSNCGIRSSAGGAILAPNGFWGSPLGPGPDPADATCGDPVDPSPVAAAEVALKLKAGLN